MPNQAPSEHYQGRFFAFFEQIIKNSFILLDIQNQPWLVNGMKIEHITDGPIWNGRAKNFNILFLGLKIYGGRIIDFFGHHFNKLGWGPPFLVLKLFFVHMVENWQDETLKIAVVVIWSDHVSDAV